MKPVIVAAGVPETEASHEFLQGMVDRMGMSYFRYGAVADAYPHKVDAIQSMHVRLSKYQQTGNADFLMDAANFLMIEFMRPKHPQAHYRPTDSRESPGRVFHGEVNPVPDPNIPPRED